MMPLEQLQCRATQISTHTPSLIHASGFSGHRHWLGFCSCYDRSEPGGAGKKVVVSLPDTLVIRGPEPVPKDFGKGVPTGNECTLHYVVDSTVCTPKKKTK